MQCRRTWATNRPGLRRDVGNRRCGSCLTIAVAARQRECQIRAQRLFNNTLQRQRHLTLCSIALICTLTRKNTETSANLLVTYAPAKCNLMSSNLRWKFVSNRYANEVILFSFEESQNSRKAIWALRQNLLLVSLPKCPFRTTVNSTYAEAGPSYYYMP